MNVNEIGKGVDIIVDILKKNAPTILTGLGIGAELGAIAMTAKGTEEAVRIIEEEKPEGKMQTLKAIWKCYLPTVILGSLSIGCFIGSNSINSDRYLALLGAYKLSESQIKDYKDKIIQIIGKDKEREISKEIDEKYKAKKEVVIVNGGKDILCKDALSGRYFKSSIDKINYAIANANNTYAIEGQVCINDIYEDLGLDSIEIGDLLGWNVSFGFGDRCVTRDVIEVKFDGDLKDSMEPCLLVDFMPKPKML